MNNKKMRNAIEFDPALRQACESASKAFTDARLSVATLKAFPGTQPQTVEEAYAIQSVSIQAWPDQVAGWKVGVVPEPHRTRYGTDRLAGPIFFRSVVHSPAFVALKMPLYPGGFSAVEAEFILEMGETVLPKQREYSDANLCSLVKDMRIGIEIASSPLATINQIGPAAIISDFGNNTGLVVGPAIADGVTRSLDSLHAKVDVNGQTVGEATAKNVPGGPLQALRFLLNLSAQRGITISAGQFISTGAVTGVHDVDMSGRSRVDFADLGWFEIAFDSIQPYR